MRTFVTLTPIAAILGIPAGHRPDSRATTSRGDIIARSL